LNETATVGVARGREAGKERYDMSTSNTTTGETGRARRRATTATKPAATTAAAAAGTKAVRTRRKPAVDAALTQAPTPEWDGPGANGEWERRVAEAAYFRAERRGFVGGSAEQDWFEAERELRALGTTTL